MTLSGYPAPMNWTRRDILRALACSGTAGVLTPTLSACAAQVTCLHDGFDRPSDGKVLVIGAGVAGLTAAHYLRAAGVDATIIEARDRIGGRTWTKDFAGAPIDLGGAWLHGPVGNPVARYCENAGIAYSPDETGHDGLLDLPHNELISGPALEELDAAVEGISNARNQVLNELGDDATVADAIEWYLNNEGITGDDRRRIAFLAEARVEMDWSGPAENASLDLWDQDVELAGGDQFIEGGYRRFYDHLSTDLDIQLNEVVLSIIDEGDSVTVQTDIDSYQAQTVILTVPLGVLKQQSINFQPALPDTKLAAIDRIGTGSLEKVVLAFDEVFWTTDQLDSALSILDDSGSSMRSVIDWSDIVDRPILLFFHGGDESTDNLNALNDTAMVQKCLDTLSAALSVDIPTPTESYVTRWSQDPYAMGSYSFAQVGSSFDDYCELATPIWEGRLLFAGEATVNSYQATVHGAMLSGAREAKRFGISIDLPGL